MAFGWSKIKYSPIAVDFGSDSLKLLQVVASETPQLVAAACVPVPAEARENMQARLEFYTAALKALLGSQPFKGRRAICSIPACHMLIQHVQIPKGEAGGIGEQVNQHLRQRLSIDPARMVIRHFPVGQISRDGSMKEEVICLAAGYEMVMNHIESARRAKLDVVGMHSEPQAIIKAFSHLFVGGDGRERTTCFIDVGASVTKVVVSHGNEMVFAKTIHAGGDQITKHHSQKSGVGFSEAREARIAAAGLRGDPVVSVTGGGVVASSSAAPISGPVSSGLAVLEAQLAAQRAGPVAAAAAGKPGVVEGAAAPGGHGHGDTIECLIDELQLCTRYYQGMFPSRQIEKLVFLGGESHHVPMCQQIARSLRIGAQLGDPLSRVTKIGMAKPAYGVDVGRPQPGWAVPMGLCLSEANL